MATVEALRTYQKELEIKNENKPDVGKGVEWALVEIAIQLHGICQSLSIMSTKTK